MAGWKTPPMLSRLGWFVGLWAASVAALAAVAFVIRWWLRG